jgi:hypothetical protein
VGRGVGYTAIFIVSAFCWSELLAAVTVMMEYRETKKQEKVQILDNTLTFLMENDVPVKLRCSIIKWTRFNIDHATETSNQKGLFHELPFELQKGQCTTFVLRKRGGAGACLELPRNHLSNRH